MQPSRSCSLSKTYSSRNELHSAHLVLARPSIRPCTAHGASKHQPRSRSTACASGQSNSNGQHLPQPPQQQQRHNKQQQQQQQQEQQQQQQFMQVLAEVQQQSYTELQQLLEDQPDHRAFSASFLFWLSAQEKKATGSHKQHLSWLAAQLVQLKQQTEFHASRRMLPPLASSLAYSNYSQWRASHTGQDLPEVAPGIALTDLYKAGEREEAKLKQWQSPQRPSSTLDNFAAASGYGRFAADAMARVRARLAGFEDDDTLQQQQQGADGASGQPQTEQQQQQQQGVSPAAFRVLDELLMGCCCREERATLLPEACMAPGLEVSATGSASSSQTSAATARVLTNPKRLLAAVAARMQEADQESQRNQQAVLPSGEGVVQALLELQEDIQAYDQHVYSRLSQRDMRGL